MSHAPAGGLEPAQVSHAPVPWHDPHLDRQSGLEHPMALPRLHPRDGGGGGHQDEDDVVAGHREVVLERHVRRLEELLARKASVGGDPLHRHVAGGEAQGLVAEGDHLARLGVDLGVGGEGLALKPAAEIVPTDRGQGVGIELIGQAVFLDGHQPPGVHDDVGVGQGAVLAGDRGIVGERVAIHAEQGPARLRLQPVFLGAHVATFVVHTPAGEAEHRSDAVAVVVDVVAHAGREAEVGAAAIEGPLQTGRDFPLDLKVGDSGFEPRGRVEAGEGRGLREVLRHGSSQARFRARFDHCKRRVPA